MKKLVIFLVIIGVIYFGVQWAGKQFDNTNKSIQEADYRKLRFKYGPAASSQGVDPDVKAKVDKEFEAIEAQQDKIAKQMNPYKGKAPIASTPAPAPAASAASPAPTPSHSTSSGSDQVVSDGSGAAAMPSVGNGGSPAVSTAKMRERVQQAGGSSASTATARPASTGGGASTTRLGEGAAVASSDFASRANRLVEPTGKPNEVKVLRNVMAYDPADPAKQMGEFVPDSLLLLGDKDAASGMVHVTFTNTDGSQVQALCRAEEMGR